MLKVVKDRGEAGQWGDRKRGGGGFSGGLNCRTLNHEHRPCLHPSLRTPGCTLQLGVHWAPFSLPCLAAVVGGLLACVLRQILAS